MFAPRLLVMSLLIATQPAFAQPASAQVRVDVDSFSFAPKPIHLRAGEAVTLTFVNRSGKSHDFTAPEFFAASRITAGAAPGGEIDLPPNSTVSVTLIPALGTYKAHCGHFMHAMFGMKDEIIVE